MGGYYNTARPHQSLNMATPAQRFIAGPPHRLTDPAGSRSRS